MNFFRKQMELFKDYFINNNIIIIMLDLIFPLISVLSSIFSFILNNLLCLLVTNCVTIIFFIVYIIYHRSRYVKITDLSYEKKAFLVNMIFNITKTRELKKKHELFNHLEVKDLFVTFFIEKSDQNTPMRSPLNVQWEIFFKSAEREITQYNVLFSRSPTELLPHLYAKLKTYDVNESEIDANITLEESLDRIVNLYRLTFQNVAFGMSPAKLTVEVKDYYSFRWNNYETLIVNPYSWGDSVDFTKIKLVFSDDKIDSTDIEAFAVNQNNLKRTPLKRETCNKDPNGNYIFDFTYDKKTTDNIFFLIVIPPRNI